MVDSVALKTAMRAPNPTTVPAGVMDGKQGKGKGKTIRFKGLTLRSKSIAAGLGEFHLAESQHAACADDAGAPRLDIPGQMRSKVIVGQVGNVGLDSWDIAHALSTSRRDLDGMVLTSRCSISSLLAYPLASSHTRSTDRFSWRIMAHAKSAA